MLLHAWSTGNVVVVCRSEPTGEISKNQRTARAVTRYIIEQRLATFVYEQHSSRSFNNYSHSLELSNSPLLHWIAPYIGEVHETYGYDRARRRALGEGNTFHLHVCKKCSKISSGEIKVRCVSTRQIYYNGLQSVPSARREIQMKPPRKEGRCAWHVRLISAISIGYESLSFSRQIYGSLAGCVSSCYSFKREASREENIVNGEKFKSATWNISYYPLISSLLCASVLSLYLFSLIPSKSGNFGIGFASECEIHFNERHEQQFDARTWFVEFTIIIISEVRAPTREFFISNATPWRLIYWMALVKDSLSCWLSTIAIEPSARAHIAREIARKTISSILRLRLNSSRKTFPSRT